MVARLRVGKNTPKVEKGGPWRVMGCTVHTFRDRVGREPAKKEEMLRYDDNESKRRCPSWRWTWQWQPSMGESIQKIGPRLGNRKEIEPMEDGRIEGEG